MADQETSRPVRVGMVLDQPFPPDARVEREAIALTEAGYEVHLLCVVHAEKPEQRKEREFIHKGIHVHRIVPEEINFFVPFLGTTTRLPYRGLIKNINRNLWNIDTVWHTIIRRFVHRFQIDMLHVHDLRLVSTGLAVAKLYDIPVVSDLHENYPALMQLFKGRNNPKRGEKQRIKWDAIQKDCTTRARGVITVSQEMKDILMGQGIPAEKVTVVPNTVDITKFESFPTDPEVLERYRGKFLLTYVGHINDTHRGVHTLLEAMGQVKDEMPDLFFVGAGGYRDHYMAQLQEIIDRHQLADRVEFTGWLDESQFVSYIAASTICVCPHIANDQTNTGIPNKVYLYHLWGKAIVASDFIPMKRYIDATGGGLCFESGNAKDLADKLRQVYGDEALRNGLGEKGKEAVLSTYNWNASAKALVELYQGIKPPTKTKHPEAVPV